MNIGNTWEEVLRVVSTLEVHKRISHYVTITLIHYLGTRISETKTSSTLLSSGF